MNQFNIKNINSNIMNYDMNINNYDTEELFTLIGCSPENRTTECINDKINDMQKNLKETDADDNELLKFIDSIKIRLLECLEDTNNNREFNMDIVKGDINPNFNNTVTRLINIDSQFKEIINENNNDTSKFTFEFSETLTKVTKFSLHSLEIPYSWYTFDPAYGTTTIKINNVYTDIYCIYVDAKCIYIKKSTDTYWIYNVYTDI